MLDVFAPVLQISRQDCRYEIQPKKIFPQAECCGCPQDQSPRYNRQRQFRPNALANTFASDRRRRRKEGSQENKWGIKQSEIQLKKCGQAPFPARRGCFGEWPEFVVTLRRKMGMMWLMN